jgi:exodeoxyribonuclease X
MAMLRNEGIDPPKVICTLKLARHLDRAGVIPQYNLQYLRYYLELNIEAKAHDALGDILVLEALFRRIYARFQSDGAEDIENEMIRLSNTPILIARMPFGKHKGMLFSEIPTDYLEWLYSTDLYEGMAPTVRYHLGRA